MKRTKHLIAALVMLSFVLASCQPTVDSTRTPEPVKAAASVEAVDPTALAEATRESQDVLTPSPVATVKSTTLPQATREPEETLVPSPEAPAEATVEPQIVLTPASILAADAALALGDPDAPVTIVEFSDYQCPFCTSYFLQTWPQLKAEFVDTGRVRYMFKDYPLTNIHPQAPKAHEAARCAGEQGAYWEMHDRLFRGQAEWGGISDHVAVFRKFAGDLGLDTSAFDACLDTGRWAGAVNTDVAEGVSLGVRGTPTFYINGYPLVGAQPLETFQYAIGLAEEGKLGEAYRAQ